MQTFLIILLSFLLAKGCSHIAVNRGRNPTIWFFAGLLFGLFALAVLLILPSRKIKPALVDPKPALLPALTILHPVHTDKLWYFLNEEKQQFGPMSLDALSRAWREGKVCERTYVWNESMENWQKLQEVISLPQS